MKVFCTGIDPEQFPLDQPFKDSFWHSPGMSFATNTFDGVDVGHTYVVYAIKVYAGFPFFYVSMRDPTRGWVFAPSLCFDVIDDRPSRLWRLGLDGSRRRTPIITLAIKEWVQEPLFFEHLVDCRKRELRLMTEAAAFMDTEYG